MSRHATHQPDLFAAVPSDTAVVEASLDDFERQAQREFVAGVRAELRATLARAQAAERLPWPNYTQSALAELRFESMSGYLQPEEAAALRDAFFAELDRLYALEPQTS